MIKVREEAYQYYFYFIQERMKLFWNKFYEEELHPVTDLVYESYRFTNVYRATDRVTQYLIKEIIYSDDHDLDEESLLLNILLFKVFNRISTWKATKNEFGYFNAHEFKPSLLSNFLDDQIKKAPIFNPAYIMTASSDKYRHLARKHARWLSMIEQEVIAGGVLKAILDAKSMQEVFQLLNGCTFIGPFLAYQYTIDMNYSPVIDFDENSFVKAGIGAQRGIEKCFLSLGGASFEDAIRYTHQNLDYYFEKFGFEYTPLFNREPTLIDLQNCFCETDKILRVKMPDLSPKNARIKQKYNREDSNINFMFPPKWGLRTT